MEDNYCLTKEETEFYRNCSVCHAMSEIMLSHMLSNEITGKQLMIAAKVGIDKFSRVPEHCKAGRGVPPKILSFSEAHELQQALDTAFKPNNQQGE